MHCPSAPRWGRQRTGAHGCLPSSSRPRMPSAGRRGRPSSSLEQAKHTTGEAWKSLKLAHLLNLRARLGRVNRGHSLQDARLQLISSLFSLPLGKKSWGAALVLELHNIGECIAVCMMSWAYHLQLVFKVEQRGRHRGVGVLEVVNGSFHKLLRSQRDFR